MSIGIFTDKKQQPPEVEVLAMIGPQVPLWHELIQFIRENYPSDEDFKFLYGKNYGWALRFRIRGQLLTSLFPTTGGFTAQVNLSPEAVERALAMQPGKNVQDAIARANPYPEGRWLFIPVESADDVQAIKRLLVLRAETKRLLKDTTRFLAQL